MLFQYGQALTQHYKKIKSQEGEGSDFFIKKISGGGGGGGVYSRPYSTFLIKRLDLFTDC